MRRFLIVLATAVLLILPVGRALAETIDVSATVEAELPPDLPVITTPTNTTVDGPTVEITGTCIVIVPHLIVVLMREGQTIGSGFCSDQGTFQITVPLVLGMNIIQVKFMTITGQSGGYGTPITVTYAPPPEAPITETETEAPADESTGPLSIDFNYDFVTYTINEETSLQVRVSGGKPPYKVFIGWGDNSSTNLEVKDADTFIIRHLYRSINLDSKKVVIRVTDSAETVAEVERALVTFQKQTGDAATNTPQKKNNSAVKTAGIWFTATAGTALAATITYNTYFAAHTVGNAVQKGKIKIKPRGLGKR